MENEAIRQRLVNRVESYFKKLFDDRICVVSRLTVSSINYDEVRNLRQVIKNSIIAAYRPAHFLQSDLSPETEEYFSKQFVDHIFENTIRENEESSLFYFKERVHISSEEVVQSMTLFTFQFITNAMKYTQQFPTTNKAPRSSSWGVNTADRHTTHPSPAFDDCQSGEEIDLADFDYDEEELVKKAREQMITNANDHVNHDEDGNGPAIDDQPAEIVPKCESSTFEKGSNPFNISLENMDLEKMIKEAQANEAARRLLRDDSDDYEDANDALEETLASSQDSSTQEVEKMEEGEELMPVQVEVEKTVDVNLTHAPPPTSSPAPSQTQCPQADGPSPFFRIRDLVHRQPIRKRRRVPKVQPLISDCINNDSSPSMTEDLSSSMKEDCSSTMKEDCSSSIEPPTEEEVEAKESKLDYIILPSLPILTTSKACTSSSSSADKEEEKVKFEEEDAVCDNVEESDVQDKDEQEIDHVMECLESNSSSAIPEPPVNDYSDTENSDIELTIDESCGVPDKKNEQDGAQGEHQSQKPQKMSNSEDEEADSDSDEEFKQFNKRPKKKLLISSDDEEDGPEKDNQSGTGDESQSKSDKDQDDDDEDSEDGKDKPRKRIRKLTSTDSTDSTKEKKAPEKKRKSIRKIMDEEELDTETISAQKAEEEKARRIEEKQKLFNDVLVKMESQSSKIDKKDAILDIDLTTKQPLIEIHEHFLQFLKPHQLEGIKFMFDRTIESVKDLNLPKSAGSGGILAHTMGLGKTLQTVCFLHTIMTHPLTRDKFNNVLIIAPSNVVLNWVEEFHKWISDDMEQIKLYEMNKNPRHRKATLKKWKREGGVLVMTVTLYSQMMLPPGKKKNKKRKRNADEEDDFVATEYAEFLANPGPDLVFIDEAHLLKNEKSRFNKVVSKIKTQRRVALTGTPLQNNLGEYYVMVNFVKPRLLGTKKEFCNRFENPINHGMHSDSSDYDVRIMKKRVHVLSRLLKDVTNRKDYRVLIPYLTPKNEYVLKIRLSDEQVEIYESYLKNFKELETAAGNGAGLFKDFHSLGYIWNHPLLLQNLDNESETSSTADEMHDFIDDGDSDDAYTAIEEDDDDDIQFLGFGSSNGNGKNGHSSGPVKQEGVDTEMKVDKGPETRSRTEWIRSYQRENEAVQDKIQRSSKFIMLMEVLKACENIGDKVIVFSQSLKTLTLIEDILRELMASTFREEPELAKMTYDQVVLLKGVSNFWHENEDYLRIDGQCAVEKRMKYIKQFNSPDNHRTRLMLISTRAGGVGINLVGANRCIIFDTSWNPANDCQAIFRIYRFGQQKPVYIYRFVSCGTMEQKIYERQILKQSLSHRVVDEKQIGRYFTQSGLRELYEFRSDYDNMRVVPKVPEDKLLAGLLLSHKDLIVETLEHDSLLENRPDEDLTKEEREEAWKEFLDPKPEPAYQPSALDTQGTSLLANPPANQYIDQIAKFHQQNRHFQYGNSNLFASHGQNNPFYNLNNGQQQVNNYGQQYSRPEIPVGRVQPNTGFGASHVQQQPYTGAHSWQQQQMQQFAQRQQYERQQQQQQYGSSHYSGEGTSRPQNGYASYEQNVQRSSVQNPYADLVKSLGARDLLNYRGLDDREIEVKVANFFHLDNTSPKYATDLYTVIANFFVKFRTVLNNINQEDPIYGSLYNIRNQFNILSKRVQKKLTNGNPPEVIDLSD